MNSRRSQVFRPVRVRAVQLLQLGLQGGPVRLVVGRVVGVDAGQLRDHGIGDRDHVQRVQPDVRVEAAVVMALLGVLVVAVLVGGGVVRVIVGVLLGLGLQRHHAGGVEHVLVAALGDGLVDRRLEALDVDDGVGVADRGDLARGELDVVRLRPGLGQAGDGTVLTRDALGDELQGIERRDDLQLTRLGRARLPGRAAGCRKEE